MKPEIERILREYEVKTLFNKNKLARAVEQVRPEETILYIAPTNAVVLTGNKRKAMPGIVVLTDRRLFLYAKILFSVQIESFNMVDINAIDSSSDGIFGSKINIHTHTKSVEILTSYKATIATKVFRLLEDTMYAAKNRTNTVAVAAPGAIDQIKKLAELRDQGILTAREFEVKKQELLSKI